MECHGFGIYDEPEPLADLCGYEVAFLIVNVKTRRNQIVLHDATRVLCRTVVVLRSDAVVNVHYGFDAGSPPFLAERTEEHGEDVTGRS